MKVVIQCASSKARDAGYFVGPAGEKILFVARPEWAPDRSGIRYEHPDAVAPEGGTWRDHVLTANRSGQAEAQGWLPAGRLYRPPVYQALYEHFGAEDLYILSAGWGLVAADFRLPVYDITFSAAAERYKRRKRSDRYEDFCSLPEDDEPLLFLGGAAYLPMFERLTRGYGGRRIAYFNSAQPPDLPGIEFLRYETRARTNWHYGCARDLVEGRLSI